MTQNFIALNLVLIVMLSLSVLEKGTVKLRSLSRRYTNLHIMHCFLTNLTLASAYFFLLFSLRFDSLLLGDLHVKRHLDFQYFHP